MQPPLSPSEPLTAQKPEPAEALAPKQRLVRVEPQVRRLQELEPAARMVWRRSPAEDRPKGALPGPAQALSPTER
ncbi:hypothetical protein [Microvirga arabica]|uniref:Uncharacterized protein n=1 Tax=Microvirga arabica TaxID=1128671 RepID=A0ABV6Y3P3_9HYPH|nr:hypothetical protein [Microvirga arabica]MBM1169694.1 hypothetical protein [Microvirga arabica]